MGAHENPVAIITYSLEDARDIARSKDLTHPFSWDFVDDVSRVRTLRDRKLLVRKDIPMGRMTPKMIRILRAVDETAQYESNKLSVERV